MIELWQTVPSFPSYQASSAGRIRKAGKSGYVLTQSLDGDYLRVGLSHLNKKYTRRVHVLVCEAFHGKRPKGKVVRHLDGNQQRNVPINLAYGTQKENIEDMKAHGTYTCGEDSLRAVLTQGQVDELRADKRYRYNAAEYAKKWGVSIACIKDARLGRTFKDQN